MLADPASLLGRLQRGRGDAIRELAAVDRHNAARVFLACILDTSNSSNLVAHIHGYADVVCTIDPPLDEWYSLLDSLPAAPECGADAVVFGFGLLGELVARGHIGCQRFLRSHLTSGKNWRQALAAAGAEAVDDDLLRQLVGRMSDSEVAEYLDTSCPAWKALIAVDERVRGIAASVAARHGNDAAPTLADYFSAPTSQARWQVLSRLMTREPEIAAGLLQEGLWDANPNYRERCVVHVDVVRPEAVLRLRELATRVHDGVGAAARRRLLQERLPTE